jgi:hypothetical protein
MCTPVSSRRAIGVLLGAAILAAACQRPSESPQAYAVRVAVQRYNQLLPDAFRASRADLLGEVASPSEVARVSSVIAGLTSQGKYMEARQLELIVIELRVDGEGKAAASTVRTRERWSYRHRFLGAPQSQSEEPLEASYRMTYAMIRKDDHWVVEKAEVDPE